MRYLGVDPGGRRVGLALGDDLTRIVIPLVVFAYRDRRSAARQIMRHAHEHGADRIVVGLPTVQGSRHTPACRRSQALARELESLGAEVLLQPEYLSTNEARRRAHEAGVPSHQPIDHIAAQVLLEEYLAS